MMTSRTNAGAIKSLLFSFLFIILILVLVFLISGCNEKSERITSHSAGTGSSDSVAADGSAEVDINLCTGISCRENEKCEEGECLCAEGYKSCNNTCISNESCCTDKDCTSGYICNTTSMSCEKGCSGLLCESNKICSIATQQCACESGYTWCENQRRCIPEDSCCTNYDCPIQECIPTISFVSLCIESGTQVGCEKIPEGEQKTFYVNNRKYNAFVKKVTEENISLYLNKKKVDFSVKEGYEISPDAFMYAKLVKVFGGQCSS